MPGPFQQPARDESPSREMHMEPVPTRMPFIRPEVRKPFPSGSGPQFPKEPSNIIAECYRVMAARARIHERPEPVEPVRSTVAPHIPSSPGRVLLRRPTRIHFEPGHALTGASGRNETAPGLGSA